MNTPFIFAFLGFQEDFLGLKIEFELAIVNESSVFESLRFYCSCTRQVSGQSPALIPQLSCFY